MKPKPPPKAGQGTDRAERAWKLAKLAATLAAHSTIQISEDEPLTSNSVWRELFLESCVSSAKYILVAAENASRTQHAYQLFDRWADYTVNQIADVFRQHDWKGLTHNTTVEEVLSKCLRIIADVEKVWGSAANADDEAKCKPHDPKLLRLNDLPKAGDLPFGRTLPKQLLQMHQLWAPAEQLARIENGVKKYDAHRIFLLVDLVDGGCAKLRRTVH